MNLDTIIPEYLLTDPSLLRLYCYLVRLVRPYPTKAIADGGIVSLRSYELCESLSGMTQKLKMSEQETNNLLAKLVELDLITTAPERALMKIQFKYLVLPHSGDNSRREEIEYGECWWEDFAAEYLEHVKASYRPKTYENSKRVMKLFGAFVGHVKLSQLNAQKLEDYKQMRKKQAKKVMDSTINMDLRTLKAAMEVGVTLGKMKENVFRGVKLIRVPKRPIRPLTPEEFCRVVDEIKEPWLVDIVKFAALTGLRRGEMVNLQWKDVKLEDGTARIQPCEAYRPKGGQTRLVHLAPEALDILRSRSRDNQWVFTDAVGKHLRDEYPSKLFKYYAGLCGLTKEIHFHSLRATFGSWAEKAGISIYKVKDLLGHSSVKTTERYVSHDQEALQMAVDRITLPIRREELSYLTLVEARKILTEKSPIPTLPSGKAG